VEVNIVVAMLGALVEIHVQLEQIGLPVLSDLHAHSILGLVVSDTCRLEVGHSFLNLGLLLDQGIHLLVETDWNLVLPHKDHCVLDIMRYRLLPNFLVVLGFDAVINADTLVVSPVDILEALDIYSLANQNYQKPKLVDVTFGFYRQEYWLMRHGKQPQVQEYLGNERTEYLEVAGVDPGYLLEHDEWIAVEVCHVEHLVLHGDQQLANGNGTDDLRVLQLHLHEGHQVFNDRDSQGDEEAIHDDVEVLSQGVVVFGLLVPFQQLDEKVHGDENHDHKHVLQVLVQFLGILLELVRQDELEAEVNGLHKQPDAAAGLVELDEGRNVVDLHVDDLFADKNLVDILALYRRDLVSQVVTV
jgi:hypothetical protein